MASTDSFHIEDRDAQNRQDALDCLNEADHRPTMSRGRDVGKPHIETVQKIKGQPDLKPAAKDPKSSPYVLVTVEELATTQPSSDNRHGTVRADSKTEDHEVNQATEEPNSVTKQAQIIPDGNAKVRAYSVTMAQLATDRLGEARAHSTKPALPMRSRMRETGLDSESVWSPDSEKTDPNDEFEQQARYWEEEL
jgi:hypothetical protein